jgi:thioredoxin-like negative regulator of GroEL
MDNAQTIAAARTLMQQGRADQAIALLAPLHAAAPGHDGVRMLLGFALRQEQRYPEAEAIFAAGPPAHPAFAFGLAQTRYELGHPAAALFGRASALDPANLDIVRNHALALMSEGNIEGAAALLRATLAAHPGWLDGHKALSTLLWTHGEKANFADHYAEAVKALPHQQDLWVAWFRTVAQTHDWDEALRILAMAERSLGAGPTIDVARLFVATESGDTASAEALLTQTAHVQGDVVTLCRIRHALRQKDAKRAEGHALPHTKGASASLYWPYVSLCWRMLGDPRAEWLDRPETLIQPRDTGMTASELSELADVLRALHTAQAPYVEQSVRGGTQTDRSVLLRHEPILAKTRALMLAVIRDYVDALPPHDPDHPLLGKPRGQLQIAGSWSVRLLRQGYNVPHTHPVGWLSTAFYVALPDAKEMGPAPAGHIAFGTPPAELGLDHSPTRTVQPAPGRLAIFPSTMWHSTVPFDDGERLVIAFDVKVPGW